MPTTAGWAAIGTGSFGFGAFFTGPLVGGATLAAATIFGIGGGLVCGLAGVVVMRRVTRDPAVIRRTSLIFLGYAVVGVLIGILFNAFRK
jgi:hypothetical protein